MIKRNILIALAMVCVFAFSSMVYAQTISNIVAESGEQYTVENGQLANGELVYIDRSYIFQSVPTDLVGVSYIKTANDDKNSTSDTFLSFDVGQNVTVYVSHDVRIMTKPNWLSTFVDTGWDLVTNDTAFDVYGKDFVAGAVILGGNKAEDDPGNSMYSVAIATSDPDPWPGGPAGIVGISAMWIEKIVTTVDITLAWDASSSEADPDVDVDGYRMFVRKAEEAYNYNTPAWEGEGLTCTLEGLPDVDLFFVVRAYNKDGESNNSNEEFYGGGG